MEELLSEGLRLGAHFAAPVGSDARARRCSCCRASRADRAARRPSGTPIRRCAIASRAKSGWAGLTFTFRGTGPSEGDFSIEGWLADVRAAVDALLARTDITGVWIAGFRLGGTLAIVDRGRRRARPRHRDLRGARVAATWVRDPDWFLEYARRTGVLRTPEYPPDPAAWIRAIANLRSGRRRDAHRAAAVAARARQRRRRRPRRRRARARRRGGRLRRAAHRRQRPAPPAARPARDRRAPRLARPSGALTRVLRRGRRRASRRACTRARSPSRRAASRGRRPGAGPRPGGAARGRPRCAAAAARAPACRSASSPIVTPSPRHTL